MFLDMILSLSGYDKEMFDSTSRKLRKSTTYLDHTPVTARLTGATIDLFALVPITPLLLVNTDAATQIDEVIDLACHGQGR
jgi:hypothetical protein